MYLIRNIMGLLCVELLGVVSSLRVSPLWVDCKPVSSAANQRKGGPLLPATTQHTENKQLGTNSTHTHTRTHTYLYTSSPILLSCLVVCRRFGWSLCPLPVPVLSCLCVLLEGGRRDRSGSSFNE